MRFILFFLKGCVLYALAFHCMAAPEDNLSKLLNSISSMQATFTQIVYDNHNKPVQKSYGRMALQRPGKFRWEITKPIPQIIIANGSKLWIYDPDLEQVTIRSLQQTAGETPALFLSHTDVKINQDYVVKENAINTNQQSFKLIPKSPDNMFESVEMVFNKNQITQMNLADHLGHITKVEFKNIKMNPQLSASMFNFKAPVNVDVIDETRK